MVFSPITRGPLRSALRPVFSPRSGRTLLAAVLALLFANAESGGLYYFDNWATSSALYQDSGGATPLTALEQAPGLILDQRFSLVRGAENVVNGDFSQPYTGTWTGGGWGISAGSGVMSAGVGATTNVAMLPPAVRVYEVTFEILTVTAAVDSISVGVGGTLSTPRSTVGKWTETVVSGTTGAITLSARGSGGWRGTLDNLSIKEIPGIHLIQPLTTSRAVLSALVNRFFNTDSLLSSNWLKNNSTVAPAVGLTTPGGSPMFKFVPGTGVVLNTNDVVGGLTQPIGVGASTPWCISFVAKAAEISVVRVREQLSSGARAVVDLTTGVVTYENGGTGGCVFTSIDLGSGFWRIRCSRTTVSNEVNSNLAVKSGQATGDGVSGIYIGEFQHEVGTTSTRYQRVGASTADYDAAGFPVGLRFDGVDDSYTTIGNIDLSVTDKAMVCAGVRKLSDAAIGVIFEHGATPDLGLAGPITANVGNYRWLTGNTTVAVSAAGYPAPSSNVVTGLGDIAGPSALMRVNGTQVAASSTTQGAGTYGNQPGFIGRRNNASLPWNGLLFSLILRGAASSDAQIAAAEAWTNQKAQAY